MSADGTADMAGMPKCTAPEWGDTIPQHIVWSCWFLEQNPHVSKAFVARANELRSNDPTRRISSEEIIGYLRWHTLIGTTGDTFKIGSNAKSLLGRLYKRAHPEAIIDNRRAWLDVLTNDEWQQILNAWQNATNGSES